MNAALFWTFYCFACTLIGLGAASISFTAWNLIVPLLLVVLQLDLYAVLFVSCIMDTTNSLVLTIFYGYHKIVDFRLALKLAPFAAIPAMIVALATGTVLAEFEDFLKGGVAYVPFVIAAGFYFRAFRTWKKKEG